MTTGRRALAAVQVALSSLLCLVVYFIAAAFVLLLTVRAHPELLLSFSSALLSPFGVVLEAEKISIAHTPLSLRVNGLVLTTSDGLRITSPTMRATASSDAGTGVFGALRSPIEVHVERLRITLAGDRPMELEAEDVAARAEPARFRQGGRLLSKIVLDGMRIALILPDSNGEEPFDLEQLPSRLHDLLPADHLAVQDGQIRVSSGSMEGQGQEVELEISAAPEGWKGWARGKMLFEASGTARAAVRLDLRAEGTAAGILGEVEFLEGSVSAKGGSGGDRWEGSAPVEGRGSVSIGQEGLFLEEGTLTSQAATFELPGYGLRIMEPFAMRVERTGAAEPQAMGITLSAGALLELSGTVSGLFEESFSARLKGRIPESATLLDRLRPLLPEEVAGLSLKGEVPLRVVLGKDTVLGVAPKELDVGLPEWGVRGRLSGTVDVEEFHKLPVLQGSVRMAGLSLHHAPFIFTRATAEAEVTGPLEELGLTSFYLSIPSGGLTMDGEVLPLGAFSARGRAELGQELVFHDVTLSAESLGLSRLSLTAGRERIAGRFSASDLPVAGLAAFLPDPTRRAQLFEWSPEGRVSVDGSFALDQGNGSKAALTLNGSMAGLGLSSPDGSILALEGGGRFALVVRENGPVRFDLHLDRGEGLVDTVYLDLKENSLHLSGSGIYDGSAGVRDLALQGGITPYFNVELTGGKLARGEQDWRYSGTLSLKEVDLRTVYATFLRDPLSASRPSMQSLEVAGTGRAEAYLSGTGEHLDVRGNVRLSGASLSEGEETPLIEGLDLELPLAYRFGSALQSPPESQSPPTMGLLSVRAVHTPAGTFSDIELPVALIPNRLIVQGELHLPLHDGGLRIAGVVVDEPLSGDFMASTRAFLERIDLSRVEGGQGLEGSIGGDLGLVSVDRAGLRAEGSLTGAIFGGDLVVDNLVLLDPLGLSRTFGADVSVQGMDLGGFSRAMGFGLITGRMDLELDDLRVAYGQPVGFTLRAESIPVKGEAQKVSLAAVNAISVVGTGASLTSTAISLFRPFVQEFAYQKIGILCVLTNDVFRINGLISDGGVEYLVRKPPFFGINVVNRNPDNRISFKDMLERINRVLPEENMGAG